MSVVRPAVQAPVETPESANAPHYGILMGGEQNMIVEGYGQAFCGFNSIPRRTLAEFVRMQVGRGVESPEALEDENFAHEWHKNPNRIVWKSPRASATDVISVHGSKGFIVPRTLIGKSFEEATELFNKVMPQSGSLVAVIRGLSSTSYEGEMESLRVELLEGANTAFSYMHQYITASKNEISNASKSGMGKKGFSQLDEDYFRELEQPLPEEVPAIATLAMGKEIAASLNESKSSSATDDILKALLEQNKMLMDKLTQNSGQAPAETKTEPAPKKAVGTKKDTN